jgi:chromate transporter
MSRCGTAALYEPTTIVSRPQEIDPSVNDGSESAAAKRKFINDVPLALIAIASFGLTLGIDLSFVLALIGSGLAYEIWTTAKPRWTGASSFSVAPLTGLLVVAGAITLSLTAEIFFEGLKAGLLTFGGAYTVIPFLQESAVDSQHWLTTNEFLDGIALSGILPAPLIIFSTFVGYLAGGLSGSLAMTFGIFIPAFVFPIFFHRGLVALANNARIRPFLLGVAAGVIGLIGAVTVDILDHSIVDLPSALLALGAFAVLYRWQSKLAIVYVVLGCGLIGAGLQLTVI